MQQLTSLLGFGKEVKWKVADQQDFVDAVGR